MPGEKSLEARERTNNKLNPFTNMTRWAILVKGECSQQRGHPSLLKCIPRELDLDLGELLPVKTLGLLWCPMEFMFKVQINQRP